MPLTNFFEDINLKKNSLFLFKPHPITTTDRTTLGGTLGLSDEGILVFDISLDAYFTWDGTQWVGINDTTEIDVFMIGGQSNMRGVGVATSSPDPSAGTVYQYIGGVFSQVTDEVGNLPSGRGSAWPSFGINYNRITGRRIAFIPLAADGTGQLPVSDSGFGNWEVNGTLFNNSVTVVNAALIAIQAAGFTPTFKGIIWGQGENDARQINAAAETAIQYQNGLSLMIAGYRTAFGANTPFYIYQTGTEITASDVGYAAVRAAQQTVVDSDPLRNKMISTNAFDFVARSLMADNIHYNQTALNELGIVGSENVINSDDLFWQRSGTNLSYMKGRVGVGIKLPTHPFQVLTIGEPAKFGSNSNSTAASILENLSAGASASGGLRFNNNAGLQGQLVMGSSANIFNPNGFSFHCFTGDMLIGSNTGNFRIFTSASGALQNATKLLMDNVGRFAIRADVAAFLNPPTIEPSAILSLTATNLGFLVPRMTEVQRDAIVSPATGLLIYQLDSTPGFYYFDGAVWGPVDTIGSGSQGFQDVLTVDSLLTTDNLIDIGPSDFLLVNATYPSGLLGIKGGETAFLGDVDNDVDSTHISVNDNVQTLSLRNDNATGTTFQIANYSAHSVGDVLALANPATGEVEWITPSVGGGSSAIEDAFNATSDWTGPSGGYYSYAFTHNLGSNAYGVTVWDDTGTPVKTEPETIEQTNNNTITIRVTDSPDNRFAGRIVINP